MHALHSRACALITAVALGACRTNVSPSPSGRPSGTVVASNMNDHTATLLDASTLATLATLPTGTAPHEVTIAHDGRWALVSNYGTRAAGQHDHGHRRRRAAGDAHGRPRDVAQATRHGVPSW